MIKSVSPVSFAFVRIYFYRFMWVMIFLKIYKHAMNCKSNGVYSHAANGNRMKKTNELEEVLFMKLFVTGKYCFELIKTVTFK